jgi:homocysteine S-methyltransferase
MTRPPFPEFLELHDCILGEGAVIERMRRAAGCELDPWVVNSAFIYEPSKRAALDTICRQYLNIGREFDLPLLLSTPTWRASRERIAQAGLAGRDLNGDNFRFLDELRSSYGDYAGKVVICGLMSCRGNAYNPAEALAEHEAYEFHAWQAEQLAAAGVDFLLAATLPALGEATGLARAQAATGMPYLVSFVARPSGTLLDGTPLHEALGAIDSTVGPPPLAYLVNCTHASFFRSALQHRNSSDHVRQRIVGLLANSAALSPEELDESAGLVVEAPEEFGRAVASLRGELGMKILGGCCGTDQRHIRCLARELTLDHDHS